MRFCLLITDTWSNSDVRRLDKIFQHINLRFLDIIQQFKVAMVYETYPTKDFLTTKILVDRYTATSPLPQVQCFGISATHVNMCKFETGNEPDFVRLSNFLEYLTVGASEVIGNRWKEEHAGSTWVWERIPRYRQHGKDLKDYLINLFGDWDFQVQVGHPQALLEADHILTVVIGSSGFLPLLDPKTPNRCKLINAHRSHPPSSPYIK
jgi:hypothetical protein